MYIQTAEIDKNIEPVLYNDKDKAILVLPTTESEDGQKYMHIPFELENYLKRRAEGELIMPFEVKNVFSLLDDYRKTGKWHPSKEDWAKSLKQLIGDNNYQDAINNQTKLSKLKQHIRKNIPENPKATEPSKAHKVRRPLEPVEIKPPVMPKELLEKHQSI